MHLLLQSSRRFFRRHPGQLLLALTGMAAGVALMRDVLIESLDGAAEILAGRDSIRITAANGPLDERLYTELARSPGSPALTPVLRQRVRLGQQPFELLGIDPLSGDGRGLLPPEVLSRLMATPAAAAANASTLHAL